MLSNEALSLILTEADRIVRDAHGLLEKATETGREDLIDAARTNLRVVIDNRNRLLRFFSLRLSAADAMRARVADIADPR